MPRTYGVHAGWDQPSIRPSTRRDSQLTKRKGGSAPNGWLRQDSGCMYGIVTGGTFIAFPANHRHRSTRWEAPAMPVTRDVDAS